MIYWEEASLEGNWFDTLYRRSSSYVFDFKYWTWFRQLEVIKRAASRSYYEHPEFWAGVIDELSNLKQVDAERRKLPEASIIRWSRLDSAPTDSSWQPHFVQIAVARVNLRQGEPGVLRKEGLHLAPDWFLTP